MMESFDLLTAHGAEEFVERTCRVVAKRMEDEGNLPMHAFVFARRNPVNGERFAGVGVIHVLAPPEMANFEDEKEAFSTFVRSTCSRTDAVGVVLCSEAWMLLSENISKNAMKRYRKHGISKEPGRREVLVVALEHHEVGSCMYTCPVERDHRGKARTGSWLTRRTGQAEGRFFELLAARH